MTPLRNWLLINTFLVYIVFCSDTQNSVCSKTCSSSMNGSYVYDFCHEQDLQLQGRCCVNVTGSQQILGLDLQGCGLSQLTGLFTHGASLQVLLLQDNPLMNTSTTDFKGLLELKYLALPMDSDCPGGMGAWEMTNTTANETLCLQELDFCLVHNVSCPSNSYCANTGPGITECLCLPGYHGYKCLRKGTFPTTVFTAGMVGSTLFVAGLLWFTQRQSVKNKCKNIQSHPSTVCLPNNAERTTDPIHNALLHSTPTSMSLIQIESDKLPYCSKHLILSSAQLISVTGNVNAEAIPLFYLDCVNL